MGSMGPIKVPVIDFNNQNLNPCTSASWFSSTCEEVRNALEEYGCFLAVYDDVKACLDVKNDMFFDGLEELFDLPTETKALNTSDVPNFGYFGQRPSLPLFERMGIEDAINLDSVQTFTNLMWPSGNPHFCESMHSFAKILARLERMVKRMVFESYGVQKHYESHIGSTTYLLKMMKYRAPQLNEKNIGLRPHTDKSFVTILHQNQVNALEIKTKNGDWIPVDFQPSSFFVMAGEAFTGWSNNRIRAAYHRVMMNMDVPRYSVGLFSYQKGITQTPEELVDDEHPLQFKPFDNFGLVRFYFTHLNIHSNASESSTLKAFCGI